MPVNSDRTALHKVVVVGAGFAGLQLVRKLRGVDVSITLIDRRNHHLFQPLLYQVATTVLSTSEIAWPIRHLFRDRPEVETLLAEVVGVDREARTVQLSDGSVVAYDTLVLATGVRHAYFGKDEWEPFAPGLKTLEDATTIRRHMLLAFERAEMEPDPAKRDALLTFAIVGAGPTGVELAGTIAELAQKTLPAEFRRIDTRKSRILLVEAGQRILAAFSEPHSAYAKSALERIGIEVMLGHPVTECGPNGIHVGETDIPCGTIIWAAGVQASPAGKWLNADADRIGRTIVRPDLTIPGDDNIFVVGDTAMVKQQDGTAVPGLAPAAKQQGAYVAKVIRNQREGKPAPKPFRYWHQGNLATIGRRAAIIEYGKFRLKGGLAWWIWGFAHIYFLIGTRSRFAVAWSWLWIYLSGLQSSRLITQRDLPRSERADVRLPQADPLGGGIADTVVERKQP